MALAGLELKQKDYIGMDSGATVARRFNFVQLVETPLPGPLDSVYFRSIVVISRCFAGKRT
jgi:hypothetical protein